MMCFYENRGFFYPSCMPFTLPRVPPYVECESHQVFAFTLFAGTIIAIVVAF
jgi:hypothetical protein